MTPIQFFVIIISILTIIELTFIISWTIEHKHKQKQKDLKESALKEDKDTKEYIREVISEAVSYLYSDLKELEDVVTNNALGVVTMAEHTDQHTD